MQTASLSQLWAKSGLVWLLFTMCIGLYQGATMQFELSSWHAHAGLLGGLLGLALSYLWFRAADPDKAVKGGFWQWLFFNCGLVVQIAGLRLVYVDTGMGMLIGLGAMVVIASMLWTVLVLWPRIR